MDERESKTELFWKIGDVMLADPAVSRGTMMRFPCLRFQGRFFASVERLTDNLIVKLPAKRVVELVNQGRGELFIPNGRVFREWIALPDSDEDQWA